MSQESGIRPEDILSDNENDTIIRGVRVRKGTIAAVLKNASILTSPLASKTKKEEAKKIIAEFAPALVVLGAHEHITWKNPDIQQEVEAAAEKLQEKK